LLNSVLAAGEKQNKSIKSQLLQRCAMVLPAGRKYVMHQPDPFAVLTVGKSNYRTPIAKKTFDPVWNSRYNPPP
jgi:hypothetical protein